MALRSRKYHQKYIELIEKRFPRVSSHLAKFEIDPIIYASSWFITLYCNSLPACYTLRIIDCFLLEGTPDLS